MKKRDGGRIWWVLTFLMIVAAVGLAGYFIGMEKGRKAGEASVTKKIPPMKKEGSQAELETPKKEQVTVSGEIMKSEPLLEDEEDYCTQIENGVRGFFRYLDKKDYVQHLEADMDTYDRFTRLIKALASRPPIPAGEGID